MRIVKEFESNSFAELIFEKTYPQDYQKYHGKFWLVWGLGDDGELYVKYGFPHHDRDYILWSKPSLYITLSEMKRVVKEFGHLVVFT